MAHPAVFYSAKKNPRYTIQRRTIMTQVALPIEHAQLPNTCQYTAKTRRGDYLVQVAWPLCWSENRVPPKDDGPISTIYLVDGDAYFFTAVEISRRLEFTDNTRTVVVGIGYPHLQSVVDDRRSSDLTPPAANGEYESPPGPDGKPLAGIEFGEASKFLSVIQNDIMSHVEGTLFPKASLYNSRKALFGHSYGGVFTLNALFTKPTLFDTFIAASPSIWFNNRSIVREQEAAFREREHPADPAPGLVVTWGSKEAKKPAKGKTDRNMVGNAREMVARLKKCPSVRSVWDWGFDGENHCSAAVTGLQRGMAKFLSERM